MEFFVLIFGVYIAISMYGYSDVGELMHHFERSIARYDIAYRFRNLNIFYLSSEEFLWLISTVMLVLSVIVFIRQIKRKDQLIHKIEGASYVLIWNFVNSIAAVSMVGYYRGPLLAAIKNSVSIRIANLACIVIEPIAEVFENTNDVMADMLLNMGGDGLSALILSLVVLPFWIFACYSVIRTVFKPSIALAEYSGAMRKIIYIQRLLSLMPVVTVMIAFIEQAVAVII